MMQMRPANRSAGVSYREKQSRDASRNISRRPSQRSPTTTRADRNAKAQQIAAAIAAASEGPGAGLGSPTHGEQWDSATMIGSIGSPKSMENVRLKNSRSPDYARQFSPEFRMENKSPQRSPHQQQRQHLLPTQQLRLEQPLRPEPSPRKKKVTFGQTILHRLSKMSKGSWRSRAELEGDEGFYHVELDGREVPGRF